MELEYAYKPWLIPSLLSKFPQSTFIIFCEDRFLTEDVFSKLADWRKEGFNNFKLKLPLSATQHITMLQHFDLPFFFNHYCGDIDTLSGILSYNPTDVYITNTLCFNMIEISNYIHSKNIKVRVCPNIAQSSWTELRGPSSFFIRPEDIDFYSSFVDVFEFTTHSAQNIVYEIYAVKKEWCGGLNEIINGLRDCTTLSNQLPAFFSNKRLNCNKRCGYGKCNFCNDIMNFTNEMTKEGIFYQKRNNF